MGFISAVFNPFTCFHGGGRQILQYGLIIKYHNIFYWTVESVTLAEEHSFMDVKVSWIRSLV
jgi:hypothetical protein